MEYVISQNAARHSVDSSLLKAEMRADDLQHQQLQHDKASRTAVSASVKDTVVRLLSRLSLLQLTSLVDETVVNQPNTDSIQVRVIRSTTQSHVDGGGDDELREVGRSFALLLQLLRRCTNWNELTSADASLSDALARLTEHEFTGGAMGYGVHTEKTVERLAGLLTATDSCAAGHSSVASSDTITVLRSCPQQLKTTPNVPQHTYAFHSPKCTNVKACETGQNEQVCVSIVDDEGDERIICSETKSEGVDAVSVQKITAETSSVSADSIKLTVSKGVFDLKASRPVETSVSDKEIPVADAAEEGSVSEGEKLTTAESKSSETERAVTETIPDSLSSLPPHNQDSSPTESVQESLPELHSTSFTSSSRYVDQLDVDCDNVMSLESLLVDNSHCNAADTDNADDAQQDHGDN